MKCWKFFFTLQIKKKFRKNHLIFLKWLKNRVFYPKYTIQPIQCQFGRNLHKTHELAKKEYLSYLKHVF